MRSPPGSRNERYVRLSEADDPLEKLDAIVQWSVFRKPLSTALKRSDGAKGGRRPYDTMLMFRVLVLQALYNLLDDQAEFQIQDRLSFMRFLGLGLRTRRRCRTPRRSGCSASTWPKPARSRTCSPASTSI